jgi:hypothetical protein
VIILTYDPLLLLTTQIQFLLAIETTNTKLTTNRNQQTETSEQQANNIFSPGQVNPPVSGHHSS